MKRRMCFSILLAFMMVLSTTMQTVATSPFRHDTDNVHNVSLEKGELTRACPAELLEEMQSAERRVDSEYCYMNTLLMQALADAIKNGYEIYIASFYVPVFCEYSSGRNEWWSGQLLIQALIAQHMVAWRATILSWVMRH